LSGRHLRLHRAASGPPGPGAGRMGREALCARPRGTAARVAAGSAPRRGTA